jgi:cytochrome c-type biogenesis protein CcmH
VRRPIIAILLGLLALPALAVQPDEILADAKLEARARALSAGLRCLVCQNQSIDDSDAPLAKDLRILIRQRLQAGDSDVAAVAFVEERYGEYVRLKPRFEPKTWFLWLTPFAAIVLAVAAMLWRQRRLAPTEAELSAAERAALERLR